MKTDDITPGQYYWVNIPSLRKDAPVEVEAICVSPDGVLVRDPWQGRGVLTDLVQVSAFVAVSQ